MQPRVRFNAKARGGSHKKKAKRGKDKEDVGQEHPDPNAPIVIPKSEEEREKERKLKMREEVSNYVFQCPTYIQMMNGNAVDARRARLQGK